MRMANRKLLKKLVVPGVVVAGVVSAVGLSHTARQPSADADEATPLTTAVSVAHVNGAETECSGFGVPNPADKYCLDLGYDLDSVKDDDGSQYAVCGFPDGTSCETWAFLEGRCGRRHSICAAQGMSTVTRVGKGNAYSQYTAVCVDRGREVGAVPELAGLTRIGRAVAPEAARRALPQAGAAPSVSLRAAQALPSDFDWRSADGDNWMTPVKNQSQCGSCWAFSAVGAIEATYNIQSDDPDLNLDLAEEYLNSDCPALNPGSCCGGWHYNALQVAVDEGIPDEGCMPYDVGYYNTQDCACNNGCNAVCAGLPNSCSNLVCGDACADMPNRMTTIDDYTAIPANNADIKNAIVNEGALAACLAMSGEFDADGVYRCTTCWDKNGDGTCDPVGQCNVATGQCVSATGTVGNACTNNWDCDEDTNGDNVCDQNDCGVNHCIVLLGYDDAEDVWIAKNSWGSGWNGDGYFELGYGECHIEDYVYSVQTDSGTDPGDCTEANAIDIGGTGQDITVSNDACLMVRGGYPFWWGTRNMAVQSTSGGTYPVPFSWENACSGSSGSATITGDWQSSVLRTTSAQCATLIDLQGNGQGTITLRYYAN